MPKRPKNSTDNPNSELAQSPQPVRTAIEANDLSPGLKRGLSYVRGKNGRRTLVHCLAAYAKSLYGHHLSVGGGNRGQRLLTSCDDGEEMARVILALLVHDECYERNYPRVVQNCQISIQRRGSETFL